MNSKDSKRAHLVSDLQRVSVVLHRPIYPRNIGMCARAMANLGLSRLVVVDAQTKIDDQAKQGAAHAQAQLQQAVHYQNLEQFLATEGEGVRIGLSGKDARMKVPDDLESTLERLAAEPRHPVHQPEGAIYFMFGAEDDGLSAAELEICHYVCRLPTYSDVNSYNLSHAVLLTLFIARRALVLETATAAPLPPAILEPAFFPSQSIKTWLETLGFDLSSPRVTIEKTLNRILLSQAPTKDELRLLDAVLQQTIRKLRCAVSKNNFHD